MRKTIKEWLESADKRGLYWAKAAIANSQDPQCGISGKALNGAACENLAEALVGAFYWANSPEGQDYWYRVMMQIDPNWL